MKYIADDSPVHSTTQPIQLSSDSNYGEYALAIKAELLAVLWSFRSAFAFLCNGIVNLVFINNGISYMEKCFFTNITLSLITAYIMHEKWFLRLYNSLPSLFNISHHILLPPEFVTQRPSCC